MNQGQKPTPQSLMAALEAGAKDDDTKIKDSKINRLTNRANTQGSALDDVWLSLQKTK